VIIIGGGISGIVTALELLGYGSKVLILERDCAGKFGGQAITAFGGMTLVGTPQQKLAGVKDSPDLAYCDWCDTAEFSETDTLPRQWARMYCERSYEDIYRWVRKHGVRFLATVLWPERGFFRPGNSVPRYHIVWGTGYFLTRMLIDYLEKHPNRKGLTVRFDHRATRLEVRNGKIAGCTGTNTATGDVFAAEADAVVVACGGVGGNLEKVREVWPKDWGYPPEDLLIGSHPFCDGTGHDMVGAVGGAVTNLDRMWNYPEGISHPFPQFERQGLRVLAPKSALWLDHTGRRVGPQPLIGYYDTYYAAKRICQMGAHHTWHVLNYKIAIKELALSGAEHNEAIRDRKLFRLIWNTVRGNELLVRRMIDESEDFIVANSLSELVDKMNALTGAKDVDLAAMKHDIRRYDEQIDRGERLHDDDQLRRIAHVRKWPSDRLRTCKFQKILDSKALPLIAIRYRMLTRKSLGGIQTDLESRVMDREGRAVAGLYAVGEAAGFGGGGINGRSSLEGTFISNCILTGRIAARSIAGVQNP
jgi:predicted oxidoreductase